MKLSDDAAKIFKECLKENNKYAIVFKYVSESSSISMRLADIDESSKCVIINDVPFIFENDADKACANWTIVEENKKLTIKKECHCCTDEACEYVCNKVTCDCKED